MDQLKFLTTRIRLLLSELWIFEIELYINYMSKLILNKKFLDFFTALDVYLMLCLQHSLRIVRREHDNRSKSGL